ncbi:ABC transporter permease [Mucilaginibacter ginkgonis]|uniref:ABC transporter permease n=1 Tax=Mucilaginibacter ginkgonis TaxID=2682091 RepID=A0A6I4HYJ3_9SPHI|nr:ABC transporter permease [Mucilaginibacter ginkgonis]QQL51328.1 ABC transporter permease [Mucilaginibacter ginkgonis]
MLKNYIKIAWRNLLKNKGFTFINITGLAIGMASAALILFWVTNEVSFDRFHEKGDRINVVYNLEKFDGVLHSWNTTPKVLGPTLKSSDPDVEDVARLSECSFLFTVGDKRIIDQGEFTDPGFLTMFTFPLIKGDAKTALNTPTGIVITQRFAQKMFGTDDALGKILKLDSNANFTVSGVMKDLPNNTRFKFNYLLPWSYLKTIKQDDVNWTNNSVKTYVLLKPNVALQTANAHIKYFTRSHSTRKDNQNFLYPASKWRLYNKFLDGIPQGGKIETVQLFALIAGFILLIACINFMNLSTARSEKRAKEVGIRKVAGAPRELLIGQFLAESILISLIAGIFAFAIVFFALPAFNQLTEKELTIPFESATFWLTAVGFVLLTGLIAGSYPAFYLSSFKPVSVLKGTFKAANALVTPRKVLVVMQFTFAITLIICTIIVKNQIQYAQNRDLGYKKDNLAYTVMSGDIEKHYAAIKTDLLASGAVIGVTKTSAPVTQAWSDSWGFEWKGSPPESKLDFDIMNTDGDFVKTMNLKMAEGRDIDPKTYATDSTAMLANEAAIKAMGLKNPVGETVKGQGHTWHIVGIVKDFILQSPYEPVKPMLLLGPKSWFNVMHYKLNPAHSTAENLKKIEHVFSVYNPMYPFDYKFIDEEYAAKFSDEQKVSALATLFASLTIIISCLGLFGLATYMAQNRVKEIGVRKVLGASVANITTLLSTDFMRLVAISFVLATPLAWWGMSTWLAKYPYRTEISIWVFILAAIATTVIAILTVSYQSIKAAIANPVKSLRSE